MRMDSTSANTTVRVLHRQYQCSVNSRQLRAWPDSLDTWPPRAAHARSPPIGGACRRICAPCCCVAAFIPPAPPPDGSCRLPLALPPAPDPYEVAEGKGMSWPPRPVAISHKHPACACIPTTLTPGYSAPLQHAAWVQMVRAGSASWPPPSLKAPPPAWPSPVLTSHILR